MLVLKNNLLRNCLARNAVLCAFFDSVDKYLFKYRGATMGLDFYIEISGEISLKNLLFKKQLAKKDETCVDSVDLMGP